MTKPPLGGILIMSADVPPGGEDAAHSDVAMGDVEPSSRGLPPLARRSGGVDRHLVLRYTADVSPQKPRPPRFRTLPRGWKKHPRGLRASVWAQRAEMVLDVG